MIRACLRKNLDEGSFYGGFNWGKTIEGQDFWQDIIIHGKN